MLDAMIFKATFERDDESGLFIGHIPGVPGAHTQAADLDELRENLRDVLELLQDEGELVTDGSIVVELPQTGQ